MYIELFVIYLQREKKKKDRRKKNCKEEGTHDTAVVVNNNITVAVVKYAARRMLYTLVYFIISYQITRTISCHCSENRDGTVNGYGYVYVYSDRRLRYSSVRASVRGFAPCLLQSCMRRADVQYPFGVRSMRLFVYCSPIRGLYSFSRRFRIPLVVSSYIM